MPEVARNAKNCWTRQKLLAISLFKPEYFCIFEAAWQLQFLQIRIFLKVFEIFGRLRESSEILRNWSENFQRRLWKIFGNFPAFSGNRRKSEIDPRVNIWTIILRWKKRCLPIGLSTRKINNAKSSNIFKCSIVNVFSIRNWLHIYGFPCTFDLGYCVFSHGIVTPSKIKFVTI